MTKNKNLNLIWEKAYCGKSGIYKSSKKLVLTPTLLKRLAISKMTDVTLISANFQDNCVLFSPHVCLLLDFSSRLEFFGAYVADAPGGATTPKIAVSLPCLTRDKVLLSAYFLQNFKFVAKVRVQSLPPYPDLSEILAADLALLKASAADFCK